MTVTGKNSYCGPYALAWLSGVSTDEAAKVIRNISGQRAVKITYARDVHGALYDLGIRSREYGKFRSLTMAKWIHEHMRPSGKYLLLVTGHYVIVDQGRVYDSVWFSGSPVELMPSRKKVLYFWEIKS